MKGQRTLDKMLDKIFPTPVDVRPAVIEALQEVIKRQGEQLHSLGKMVQDGTKEIADLRGTDSLQRGAINKLDYELKAENQARKNLFGLYTFSLLFRESQAAYQTTRYCDLRYQVMKDLYEPEDEAKRPANSRRKASRGIVTAIYHSPAVKPEGWILDEETGEIVKLYSSPPTYLEIFAEMVAVRVELQGKVNEIYRIQQLQAISDQATGKGVTSETK